MGTKASFYLGVELPPEFPKDKYDDAISRIETSFLTRDGREHARGGMFGVGYRYLSMAAADEDFRRSLQRLEGGRVTNEERVQQETALFLFAAAACSVVECFSYAAFATAAGLRNVKFRIGTTGQRRAIRPESTSEALGASYPDLALVRDMETALASPIWEALNTTRNVLIHQASSMYLYSVDDGVRPRRPPTIQQSWHAGEDLVVEADLTSLRRRWLGETVTSLVSGLESWLAQSKSAPAIAP